MTLVAFVLTAAAGTVIRWHLSMSVPIRAIGTLIANVTGAFALGLLSTASAEAQLIGGVAGLGALTTFSTFVGEVVELAELDPRWARSYTVITVVIGVGAAWMGLRLA